MQSSASTVEQYLQELPAERKDAIVALRNEIKKNIPKGFKEQMSYGMIGYVVPHSIYPGGYHCTPSLPLPFMNIASQKNFIALYHMGLHGDNVLLNWFVSEYAKVSQTKIDMGKGCIRFKKPENIPFKLVGELAKKISVRDWINLYESNLKK